MQAIDLEALRGALTDTQSMVRYYEERCCADPERQRANDLLKAAGLKPAYPEGGASKFDLEQLARKRLHAEAISAAIHEVEASQTRAAALSDLAAADAELL